MARARRAALLRAAPGIFLVATARAQIWQPQDPCVIPGITYHPPNMPGQGRSIEATWQACQMRCQRLQPQGCAHFSFWPDGGCHLSDSGSVETLAWGSGADKMVSGQVDCQFAQFPIAIAPAVTPQPPLQPQPAPLPPAAAWPAAPAPIPATVLAPVPAPLPPPKAADESESPASEGPPDKCPGSIDIQGHGRVAIVPTGWHGAPAGSKIGPIQVEGRGGLAPHMDGRAYFASQCTGQYNHSDYIGLNLLNKRIEFVTDLTGAGCGCNAAFYLVSMKQNARESTCYDYYCDANRVCGVSCDEIDIMEANQHAFHATLHTLYDHSGIGGGYGGGDGWNGPRDFTAEQYGPGAKCVDTTKPFKVTAEFPTDWQGNLEAMSVALSQIDSTCEVRVRVGGYKGNSQLTESLKHGMTPVFSYWKASTMLWMDGQGADGRGPCPVDLPDQCGDKVRMYDFAIHSIGSSPSSGGASPSPSPPWTPPTPAPSGPTFTSTTVTTTVPCSITRKADCSVSQCCHDPGMQCYQKDEFWSACQLDCIPGIDPRDSPGHQSPWTCKKLGTRSPGEPIVTTTTLPTTTAAMKPFNEACAKEHDNCAVSKCCYDPGMQCFEKHHYWSSCKWMCESTKSDPWTCALLGARTLGDPITTTTQRPRHEVEFIPPSAASVVMFSDPDAPACSRTRKQNCHLTHCCQDPGMQCYEKHRYWAACQIDCVPGVDLRDDPDHRTPWSCAELGPRTPGRAAATTTTTFDVVAAARSGQCARTRKQNCMHSKCCEDPGMRCYEKNQWWAACQLDCTPGIDPRDHEEDRSPWTCTALGPRSPGSPIITTTTAMAVATTTGAGGHGLFSWVIGQSAASPELSIELSGIARFAQTGALVAGATLVLCTAAVLLRRSRRAAYSHLSSELRLLGRPAVDSERNSAWDSLPTIADF